MSGEKILWFGDCLEFLQEKSLVRVGLNSTICIERRVLGNNVRDSGLNNTLYTEVRSVFPCVWAKMASRDFLGITRGSHLQRCAGIVLRLGLNNLN